MASALELQHSFARFKIQGRALSVGSSHGSMLGLLEIIASLWRENSSRDLKTELCTRVLELCSRSESWS